MSRFFIFLIIVCAGVAVLRLIPVLSQTRKSAKTLTGALFGLYAVGNIYYTLLSRLTISAAELEAKILLFIARLAHLFSAPIKMDAGAMQSGVQAGAAVEEQIESATNLALDPNSAFYAVDGFALNVLLYLPMGYLLPCVFPRLRRRTMLVVALSFAISLGTETIQRVFSLGTFDWRDLVCNTLGAVIGVILYKTFLAARYPLETT